jgi:hypothetical protein
METWTKNIVNIIREDNKFMMNAYKKFTMADVIIGLYNNLLGGNLDEPTEEKLLRGIQGGRNENE